MSAATEHGYWRKYVDLMRALCEMPARSNEAALLRPAVALAYQDAAMILKRGPT